MDDSELRIKGIEALNRDLGPVLALRFPTRLHLIGAGSVSLGRATLCDLFAARESLAGSTVALVDTDSTALRLMARVAQRMNEATGQPFVVEATTDCRAVLPGADFVVISVAVRRDERWRHPQQPRHEDSLDSDQYVPYLGRP